jgi:formylglycine-generating enzyme required for sulfatase activity
MNHSITTRIVIHALLAASTALFPSPAAANFAVEVTVTAGLTPLPEASVVLDLNANGIWEEHFGEPRTWTDLAGVAVFSDVVSIEDPAADAASNDWQPLRIMMSSLRGSVGAPDLEFDYLLPAGSPEASLAVFDVKGRRIVSTQGQDELTLAMPGGLPSGVYFLRLSAGSDHASTARFTSIGARTRTIRAHQASAAEALAAGWGRVGEPEQKSDDEPHHINLIVEHDDYPVVVQPEVLVAGFNEFAVDVLPADGFVYIPPGTFFMGSPTDEPGRNGNEARHPVTLTRGFYMSQDEVTAERWHQVMGGAPSTSQLPKDHVSWDMAVQFCNAQSLQEGLTPAYTIHGPDGDVTWNQDADGYRLPTEAEWEYACRAGSTTAFANGPITDLDCSPLDPNLDAMGWYCGNNSPGGPKQVGQKLANGWALHDLHGNVWEWVWDGYRADYQNLPAVDPVHDVSPGVVRVIRGGSWDDHARRCRSAFRVLSCVPSTEGVGIGFRPVRSAI